ncbi:hypothetical protein OG21DRAFT_1272252 [Imleria badia]|nr:hypothetical protein OG21DRAFT_1272252 [Imleria badia]
MNACRQNARRVCCPCGMLANMLRFPSTFAFQVRVLSVTVHKSTYLCVINTIIGFWSVYFMTKVIEATFFGGLASRLSGIASSFTYFDILDRRLGTRVVARILWPYVFMKTS